MKDFKTYIRTKMLKQSRRKDFDYTKGVPCTIEELKQYKARFPMAGIKETIQDNTMYCLCLDPGTVNLALLNRKPQQLTALHRTMWQHLLNVDITEHQLCDAHGFDWFRMFLQSKQLHNAIDYFFTVDNFSGRIHTPVTSLYREYRKLLTLYGEATTSLDVAQMQPSLLAQQLLHNVGENSFSDAVFRGGDVYVMIQSKAGLKSREEAKKKFFEIAFSKPSNELAELFDGENWIDWINWYKCFDDDRNPHGKEKTHSNLAFLLQSNEVLVMTDIWQDLAKRGIPFLTVHDEIICRTSDIEIVEEIMINVLSQNLQTFKINRK